MLHLHVERLSVRVHTHATSLSLSLSLSPRRVATVYPPSSTTIRYIPRYGGCGIAMPGRDARAVLLGPTCVHRNMAYNVYAGSSSSSGPVHSRGGFHSSCCFVDDVESEQPCEACRVCGPNNIVAALAAATHSISHSLCFMPSVCWPSTVPSPHASPLCTTLKVLHDVDKPGAPLNVRTWSLPRARTLTQRLTSPTPPRSPYPLHLHAYIGPRTLGR
jgi:hypothetical protein